MAGRWRMVLITACALSVLVSGCSRPVSVSAGPSATDPKCAEVLVNLPAKVGARERTEVTSQATAAWSSGTESSIVRLVCGAEPMGPTTAPCTTIGTVDWVVDEPDPGKILRYRSFGRVPAVELTLASQGQDGLDNVLSAVSTTMASFTQTHRCV